ncbi:MAG: hypothetical protein U0Q03_06850 [Acidimicrobiales bacterium]
MNATLEDRLAAAGEQLDRMIDATLECADARRGRQGSRRLAVAAALVLVCAGVVALATRHDPAPVGDEAPVVESSSTPSSDAVPTSVATPESTTAATDSAVTVDTTAAAPETSSTTPLPPPAPSTTVPVDLRPMVAIGESVMLGAAPQLQTGGFVVNADESLQGEATADVVGRLRAAGQIGRVVVLQVGTNGPVSQATYDLIMSFLPADEVPVVRFLTVHAPGKGWIEQNNARIWALKGRYSNVDVLDWDGLVASGQVPGVAGDGIHLGTDAAKQFYANYVFGIIGRNDLVLPLPES